MTKSELKSFLLVALFCLLALPSSGCKKSDDKVLAKFGSTKIMKSDFEKEISNSPAAYQNYLSTLEGKKQFLDILLREKILLKAAEKSGIGKNKEIQQQIKEYKEKLKQDEEEFRKTLILKEYLRELQDGALKVTETEMKGHYEQNKNDFLNPVTVTASHILSPTEDESRNALKRLKKGEDFAKVAREVSTDPSAFRGGMIGEITRGDLGELPEFENTLFGLKTGGVSDVVKTKLGFHIIKKNGETKLPPQTFEQVALKIRRMLEKKKFDDWYEKNKKESKLWVDEQLLTSILIPRPQETNESKAPVESRTPAR